MNFREDGYAAVDWAADYLEHVHELPVLARVKPGELSARLPEGPPDHGEPFANVLRDLDELIVPALTNWQHPRFFAYFAVTSSEPGILAELIAATLNQVAITWRASPASTELELRVVDWVRRLLGLPEGWHGHIEDTASTSTLAALIAARHVTGREVVVCSEHAHSSVDKAARMLGMDLRKVPVDGELRMRADDGLQLDDAASVVATVGTTSFASVDPVRALAERAREAGAWLHVDAAYAGPSWICEEERWSQDGVELADSLVVNPHKWLLTPMDCSLLWTSRPDDFRKAFSLVPEYLRSEDVDSLSEYGPALGRRFRSLKLWAVLRCYGRDGLQRILREHIRLANLFAAWVDADPDWELVAPLRFSLVVFRLDGSDEQNEALLERVNRSGEIFISHTRLNGRYVLRLAIGNARTTEDDVRRAWDVLRREAATSE